MSLALWLAAPWLLASPALAIPPPPSLEQEVAARCGDLSALQELSFTFVVEKGGEEKARRRHTWRPSEGTITVQQADTSTTVRLVADMPSEESDARWAELAPGVAAADAMGAWAAFVNDQYWLLAPCKVLDAGVSRAEEEPAPSGNRVLALSFEGVGLTPGDRYWLEVAPDGRVVGWRFVLQSGREGAFTWSEHTRAGPVEVSLLREAVEGDFTIRFEDVQGR